MSIYAILNVIYLSHSELDSFYEKWKGSILSRRNYLTSQWLLFYPISPFRSLSHSVLTFFVCFSGHSNERFWRGMFVFTRATGHFPSKIIVPLRSFPIIYLQQIKNYIYFLTVLLQNSKKKTKKKQKAEQNKKKGKKTEEFDSSFLYKNINWSVYWSVVWCSPSTEKNNVWEFRSIWAEVGAQLVF